MALELEAIYLPVCVAYLPDLDLTIRKLVS
jgi:hypothetical protein